MKIKIGGIPYKFAKVNKSTNVCHDKSGAHLFGQISYSKHSIRVLRGTKQLELRSLLHEVIHGIVEEYAIRELKDDNNNHLEVPIEQLSKGLAEVLESVGIKELK